MKKRVLYIHGFMSGSNSETVYKLRKRYDYKYEFIVPELDGDPLESISKIDNIIREEKPSLIIGSSLGGYYALMCDSGDIPIIVINPCVDPYNHLQRYLDIEREYHSKRKDGKTSYKLTRDILEHYKECGDIKEKVKSKIGHLLVLLSTNDEILGNSGYKFFADIEEEIKYPYKFFKMCNSFGHRVYPFGISRLCNAIDDVMYG